MELPIDDLRDRALQRISEEDAAPVFVTVSGAHLYGFASPDSDFDVRGCHLLPLNRVASLFAVRETIELSSVDRGRQIDFVSHDAGKFFRLMLNRNGYVLEQVFSPLVVVGGADLEELRDIAKRCVTRGLYHHYAGFFGNQLRLLEREQKKRVKTLLYLYRVLLTGIHVLRTGEIEANLLRLLDVYPLESGVRELIQAKVSEQSILDDKEVAVHRRTVERLRGELDDVFARSTLSEATGAARELDEFLVRLRTSPRAP